MKTTDSRDPLDRQIDDLLARRPLEPSPDFVARSLAAARRIEERRRSGPGAVLLRFGLPLAAAAALVLLLRAPSPGTAPASASGLLLDSDIFFLEEGLSGLAGQIDESSLPDGTTLLQTLDALDYGLES